MRREGKYIYRLDDVGKAVLIGLYKHGKAKPFSQLLDEGSIQHDSSRQVEVAISLESLELIQSVSYRLPLDIRAELTPLGESLVKSLLKPKNSRVKTAIDNVMRKFDPDFDYLMNA